MKFKHINHNIYKAVTQRLRIKEYFLTKKTNDNLCWFNLPIQFMLVQFTNCQCQYSTLQEEITSFNYSCPLFIRQIF